MNHLGLALKALVATGVIRLLKLLSSTKLPSTKLLFVLAHGRPRPRKPNYLSTHAPKTPRVDEEHPDQLDNDAAASEWTAVNSEEDIVLELVVIEI